MDVKQHALYQGDEFKMIGTIQEIADFLKVNRKTVIWYKTPTHLKRATSKSYIVIECEE